MMNLDAQTGDFERGDELRTGISGRCCAVRLLDVDKLFQSVCAHEITVLGGPTGAGKTTVARLLAQKMERNAGMPVVSLDRYFRVKNERASPKDGRDCCDRALHMDWLAEDVGRLLAGETVDLPLYYDNLAAPLGVSKRRGGGEVFFAAGGRLLIESVFALHPAVLSMLRQRDVLKVYLDAPEELRLLRRMVREDSWNDATPLETLRGWPALQDAEETFVVPTAKNADMICYNCELELLRAPAERCLSEARCNSNDREILERIERLERYLDELV